MNTFKSLLYSAAVSAGLIGAAAPAFASEPSAADLFVAAVLVPQVPAAIPAKSADDGRNAQERFVAQVLQPATGPSGSEATADDGRSAPERFVATVLNAR